MGQRVEPGRFTWAKAKLTIGDGATVDVHLNCDGVDCTALEMPSETVIAKWTIALDADGFRTADRIDGKSMGFLGEDGVVYVARSIGCGCGGG